MFYRCQKFTTNQYKDKRKGSKQRSKVYRRQPWSGAPDCVRCIREDQIKLASFGNLGRPLRYNSPDCRVQHRTVRCASGATTTSRQRSSAENIKCATVRACARRSQSRRQKAHRTVYRTCPVHHQTVRWPQLSKLQRSEPNGLVTWLAHRTVRCAIRQKPSPTTILVVGAINTLQPPLFKTSKHSLHLIQYKGNTQHSKTQIKASDRIKVPNSTLVFRTCEEIELCSFVALVAWLAFFFLSFLLSKPCKRSKRHQLCGGSCGV
jgi:hypothetical protein